MGEEQFHGDSFDITHLGLPDAVIEFVNNELDGIVGYSQLLHPTQELGLQTAQTIVLDFATGYNQKTIPRFNLRLSLYEIAYNHLGQIPHEKTGFQNPQQTAANLTVLMDTEQLKNTPHLLISALHESRGELTADQFHTLALRFLGNLSLQQVGLIIHKEPNNIKSIQNRGMTEIKKKLGIQ